MPKNPSLHPPSQPAVFPSDPNAARAKRRALIVLAVLTIIAAAVVFILPHWLSGSREKTLEPRVINTARPPAPAEAKTSEQETKARQLLNKTLELKARLDNEGAKTWGQKQLHTSYKQVQEFLKEADSHFNAQRFDRAAAGYQKTITAFQQLEASRPKRLNIALKSGEEALEQSDAALARQHFQIALAADIGNKKATAGLLRVESLPRVLELLEKGRNNEDSGLLNDARKLYQDALKIDKNSKTAREHLQRVEQRISDRDFQRAMSVAMSAFNRRDIGQARKNLNIAKKIQPDNEAVRDLNRQISAAERSAELQRLSKQASRHEQDELWDKALPLYIRALTIDASAGFAQRGKIRAERLITLNRAIRNYLANPGDLQAPEHRSHARNICDTALAADTTGPKLKAAVTELRALIEDYDRPVPVRLQSDHMTDVRIYRVGAFGLFLNHQLQLTPGRYKAQGTRSGYRDTTIEFTVPVDGTAITVRVACEEKL